MRGREQEEFGNRQGMHEMRKSARKCLSDPPESHHRYRRNIDQCRIPLAETLLDMESVAK
jgi:hypothetical protein